MEEENHFLQAVLRYVVSHIFQNKYTYVLPQNILKNEQNASVLILANIYLAKINLM